METLLLRLAGPLQAWGTASKFNRRTTGREPTKSGVIGLIAAALGRSRDAPVDDLVGLRFGVRIDQGGELLKDYHTVHHPDDDKLSFVTERFYLADAVFLVGLEGDATLLLQIEGALQHPFYPLYLGRRSCPPVGPVSLGLRSKKLEEALADESWQASSWYQVQQPPELCLEVVADADYGTSPIMVRDVPLSFSQSQRRYDFRTVSHDLSGVPIINKESRRCPDDTTEHDALAILRKEVN